jgi:DNA-directed RNA polymerase sigma subunit (sigma70/sigma32)
MRSEQRLSSLQDLVECMDLARKTRDLLSHLGTREQEIRRLRFGIGKPMSYTLSAIGKRFGLSREGIR